MANTTLRSIRLARGKTLEEFARGRISPTRLSFVERGYLPKFRWRWRPIARLYGLSLNEFEAAAKAARSGGYGDDKQTGGGEGPAGMARVEAALEPVEGGHVGGMPASVDQSDRARTSTASD